VVLKVRIDGKDIKVSQAGKPVAALSPGVYPVSLDAGNLTAEKVPWKLADIDADLPPSLPQ
jgi:antitoxin (DNA-binding transcriptional repressor) of toxin-antitoxin stability system